MLRRNAAIVNAATECCYLIMLLTNAAVQFIYSRSKKDLAHDVVRTQYEVVKYVT